MYGNYLKYHRISNNLTQKELAAKTGISQQSISTWENNTNEPSIIACVILADFYGITVDELIGHEPKKNY